MKLKIILLLKKLMRHERSARALNNTGEADNFAERINALRQRHGITEEIPLEDDDDTGYDGEYIFTAASPMFRRTRIAWEEALCVAVGEFFKCRVNIVEGTNLKIVVGEKTERAKTAKSYLHLYAEAKRLAHEYLIEISGSRKLSLEEKRINEDSFLFGFSYGVFQRMQIVKAAEAELERINEELRKLDRILPPSAVADDEPAECRALARSEKIVIRSENNEDKKKSVDEKYPPIQSDPVPADETRDEESMAAGIYVAAWFPMNEEIEEPAQRLFKAVDAATEKLNARRREIHMRNAFRTGEVFTITITNTTLNRPTSATPFRYGFIFSDDDQ